MAVTRLTGSLADFLGSEYNSLNPILGCGCVV